MIRVSILGGGISGLATAWFIQERCRGNVHITLYEKSARLGGWIRSYKEQGWCCEEGPRGFRPTGRGAATLALVRAVGADSLLIPVSPHVQRRYLWIDGAYRRLSPWFFLRQAGIGGVVRDLLCHPTQLEDETVGAFTSRHFHPRVTHTLMDALSRGVFGGEVERLSMRSAFPTLWEMEKKHGSLLKGFMRTKREPTPTSLYSFAGGMETLITTLVSQLDIEYRLSTASPPLTDLEADYVISTIPTSSLSYLLDLPDPILHYQTLSTVHLAWQENLLPLRGYGFLVPTQEKAPIFGMTWDSEIFPQKNTSSGTHVCVMIGTQANREELIDIARESMQKMLHVSTPPAYVHTTTAYEAIPQYTLSHHRRIAAFREQLPNKVYAIGTCFEGIGINDCIYQAQQLAARLFP